MSISAGKRQGFSTDTVLKNFIAKFQVFENLDFSFIRKAQNPDKHCHARMRKLWVARILCLSPELCHEGVQLRPKSYCSKYETSSPGNALIAFNVTKCYFIGMDSHKARQLIRDLWSSTASKLITFTWSSLSGFTHSLFPYRNLSITVDLLCILRICLAHSMCSY